MMMGQIIHGAFGGRRSSRSPLRGSETTVIVGDFGGALEPVDNDDVSAMDELDAYDNLSARDQFIMAMREVDQAITESDDGARGREMIALWMAAEAASRALGVDTDSLLESEKTDSP